MNENLQMIGQSILHFFMTAAWKILLTVLILVVGFKLVKIVIKSLKKSRGFSKLDPGVQTFFISGLNVLLKALLIITVAAYLGIPMASMVAVLGSAGLAIGLALQGSLANVSGGVILLIFKPFKIGDFVSVGGESGTVTEIGLFYTYLRTPDNRRVIVPNGEISNKQLVNVTAEETRRLDLQFSVGYDTDIEKAKQILLNCAAAQNLVLREPAEPFAFVLEYADSAIVLELRAWCRTEDYWTVRIPLYEHVKNALDAAGIQIPFPQMDVHVSE